MTVYNIRECSTIYHSITYSMRKFALMAIGCRLSVIPTDPEVENRKGYSLGFRFGGLGFGVY